MPIFGAYVSSKTFRQISKDVGNIKFKKFLKIQKYKNSRFCIFIKDDVHELKIMFLFLLKIKIIIQLIKNPYF